jgi:hypothetical protein
MPKKVPDRHMLAMRAKYRSASTGRRKPASAPKMMTSPLHSVGRQLKKRGNPFGIIGEAKKGR